MKRNAYCTVLYVIDHVAGVRQLSRVDTVHLDVEIAIKDPAVKVDIAKFCANSRTKIQTWIYRAHSHLISIKEALRNDVGALPAFGSVTRDALITSCIFAAYYVSPYVQALSGPGTPAAEITVPGLAFLWVILHKLAGDAQETSRKRYKKAREWINAALTDADVLNVGKLVHGTSDVLALAEPPQSTSSSSSSEDEEEQAPVRPPPIRSVAAQQRGGTPAAVR